MARTQNLSQWCFSRFRTWWRPSSQSPGPQSLSCIRSLYLSEVEAEGTDGLFIFASLKYNLFMERILYLESKHLGLGFDLC